MLNELKTFASDLFRFARSIVFAPLAVVAYGPMGAVENVVSNLDRLTGRSK